MKDASDRSPTDDRTDPFHGPTERVSSALNGSAGRHVGRDAEGRATADRSTGLDPAPTGESRPESRPALRRGSANRDEPSELAEDPRVAEVAEAYLAELERGGRPSREAYVARHPELAEAIRACLEGLELLRSGLGPGLSDAGSDVATLAAPGLDRLQNPLGDFQIVRELARGGMGVVYEAIQLSLSRPVALKVLPFAATLDARQLQRFKNEAQAAALLHHTNIVPIYAVGCERGVHFYAMQLINGRSLAEIVKQLRHEDAGETTDGAGDSAEAASSAHERSADRRSAAETSGGRRRAATVAISSALTAGGGVRSEGYHRRAAQLMAQAADALEHAHQQGVVHRDIKPANLLVDAAGDLWIADFGLAQFQAETSALTRSGDLLGTLRYMSPEQTTGQRTLLDHRTDIYSLGATFYELLTLEPVFAAENRQSLLYQVLNQEPRAPRSIRKQIPAELETIVLKTLQKNPADRYATAAELAADIRRYLNHQPIRARRASPIDRLRKWSKRHPSFVAACVLSLVVVAVASLLSTWRISQEQLRTEAARRSEQHRAELAENRFRQAREAVDMLIRVSEDELADKPYMLGARRRLLQTVLTYYQDFIEQRRGDPRSQAELSLVQDRVKGILYELDVLQREYQIGLVGLPYVQTDLRLTADQQSQVGVRLKAWTDERTAAFTATLEQAEDARRRQFVEIAERHYLALARVLTPAQSARLRQIALQVLGVFAFKDPDVVDSLRLTREQVELVRQVERQALMRLPASSGEGGGYRWRPYLPREQAVAKIVESLDPDQRRRWEALIGPPVVGLNDPSGRRSPGPPSSPAPTL